MNHKPTSIFPFLAALAALAAFPMGVRADTECTDGYLLCLNSAAANHDAWGQQHFDILDDVAYLECGAEWTGCVRKKVLGI
ncbi:MAG: hypothetical protein ACPHQP_05820 [Longimicrobiales bacterium]